jgi:hypothetical protein
MKLIIRAYYFVMVFIKLTLIPFFSTSFFTTKNGARWLIKEEEKLLYPSWNTGLIIDGKNKRLSEKESF